MEGDAIDGGDLVARAQTSLISRVGGFHCGNTERSLLFLRGNAKVLQRKTIGIVAVRQMHS